MTAPGSTIELPDFELVGLLPGEGDPAVLADHESGEWCRAVVPGGVHESLIEEGRIDHPFFGADERKDAWIDEREWWYRTRFPRPVTAPGQRTTLVFDGLDTVAEIWLNGRRLGRHSNQFRPAEFDVSDELADANVLLVRFSPPLAGREIPPSVQRTITRISEVMGRPEAATESGVGLSGLLPRATSLRKASFSWGWDFGPKLPSIGIWRGVRLRLERGAAITGHHVGVTALAADHSSATVAVRVDVDAFDATRCSVRVVLVSPSGRRFEATAPVRERSAGVELRIDDPELWWTHDLGQQNLHDVRIELSDATGVLDGVDDTVGLRTIVLDRQEDDVEGGRLFRFVLNGEPLFVRGAAWLPASVFVGSVSAETHRDRVLRAREGNLTMLRVWGGGVYEHDSFYAACDELGVLVWQDFMFACTDYPSGSARFVSEVRAEAEYQVSRLRNRACLALWAGNNEIEVLHLIAWGEVEPGDWGWSIFHELLPQTVAELDGLVPYWPGSPWGEGDALGINGESDGDRHDWEVWHGLTIPGLSTGEPSYPTVGDSRHYRRYADDSGKFISEFGIHASPELATLERWMPGVEIHDEVFDLHNKDNPKNKGDELLSVTTGIPTTLREYIDLTQAVQAEGMSFAVEHFRRRQPHTSGALVWQFNDVWPGLTWSLIDVDGVPKSAYYALARASAPVAASFRVADGQLELWLANNTREEIETELDIEVGRFDGAERKTERIAARVRAASSAMLWSTTAPDDGAHYAWVSSPDGLFPDARKHFAELGELALGDSEVIVEATASELTIISVGYSYSVRIEQPVPGIRLSDNCFDLRDGDRRTITVSGVDASTLRVTATRPRASAGEEALS
ncbi:glycoside hydrolase family 2 protein [Myceligenerans xiligouense]|uniref:beta-mannosidase n=1 Tax=Myceligenerans xiligouense TaxID=253184 RepID=A0A3N4YPW3_9MICO|nr:sugar-binding domain-containing protein [Myceligenerans xiligouense]RPF22653.1 beta-mannosidase [Myceligenerans xiligouense]